MGALVHSTKHVGLDKESLERLFRIVKEEHEYDFSQYATSSLTRRVERLMALSSISSINELVKNLKNNKALIAEFVNEITVNTTEMFRDDFFWTYMRKLLVNICSNNHGTINIWHAGCSTGEEVISMSILLSELGLEKRVQVLATDINETVVNSSRKGVYPLRNLKLCEENYVRVGGRIPFEKYYKRDGNTFQFNRELLRNITFAVHDLVKDEFSGSFNLVICRNVFIYFNKELQDMIIKKITRVLKLDGYLAIGSKETIMWSRYAFKYNVESEIDRIYQLKS